MQSVVFYNLRGGVGSTLMAAHLCHLAHAQGLRVHADDQDRNRELTKWLEGSGIPIGNAAAKDAELRVHDVRSEAAEVAAAIQPGLLVMGMYDAFGEENAVRFIETYNPQGPIVWVPTKHREFKPIVPKHLHKRVQVWPPVLLRRAALRAAKERRLVWEGPARTAGGLNMEAVCSGILELLTTLSATEADSIAPELEAAQREIIRAAAGVLQCYSRAFAKLSRSLASRV